MFTTRPGRILVSATVPAAALVLVLTGCSGGGSGSVDAADSPLQKYLASAWGGDLSEQEQMERFEKENLEREELVAGCMTEEGFEYIPVTDNGAVSFSSGDEWKPDDREWVAQYGYGNVNWPGRDEAMTPEPGEEYIDPNQDYVMSLSESEQAAYYEALYGAPPEEEVIVDGEGSYEYNWETAGCYGWAQHEMDGDNPYSSDEHKPLMDALNDFYTNVYGAAEFTELDAEWSQCMDENGYPGFTAQQDASMSISDELNAYYENQTEWVENDPELAKIGEKEIDIALVDLDCREKVDYRATQQEMIFALEEEFIADHKAELEAFKAAAEQGR